MTEKELRRIQFETGHRYPINYIAWFDTEWRNAVNRIKTTSLDLSKVQLIPKA